MGEAQRTAGALPALRAAARVALICHQNPDNDCVGGMMALTHALRRLGKAAHPLSPDPVPDYLRHVPGSEEIAVAPGRLPEVDLVVTVEAASPERTEPIWTNARDQIERLPLLNIDHHASNTGYGTERIFEPRAASVCEVLYRVIGELGVGLDPTIARCLLTGVVGDTRSFRTSSTTPETLRVAGELIAAGAPLSQVSDAVHKYRRADELAVWSDVLGRARCEDEVLWTHLTREDAERRGLSIEQIDGLVEFLSDTRDVAAALIFKVLDPDRIRVSMRSDGRVDLTRIAARWGGGGHPQAAGCTIRGLPLPEAEAAVVAAVKSALAAG
ncbi:MAG TPA: bifunctional oligoribonuclease/PAP phosphatase NrnA [Chloroflexota bacterium]|nr:bifunctional oligoribonuclease/PAP phosphatase NrnA [Chloroflexota bacterium]